MNIFDEALAIISARGICKGELEDSHGRVCIYGALRRANLNKPHPSYFSWDPFEARHMDQVALRLFPDRREDHLRGPGQNETAAAVNNHPNTTLEDVQLILKHASYEWDLQHPLEESE